MNHVILFLKSHVASYTRRDGTYVKPHERKGEAAAPEQLSLFTHAPAEAVPAAEDPRRKFYVTMIRDKRVARLAGPFNQHVDALAHVEPAKAKAIEVDPWSHFDAFGTAAVTADEHKPGVLNGHLGIGMAPAAGDGIEVRPGKGLIKDKFLADVDGDGVPGGPFDSHDAAHTAAKAWRKTKEQHKAVADNEAVVKRAIADRIKAGGEPTEADLKHIGLRSGSSDLRWFIPAAASLFGITSRAVRPHIAGLISTGHTDMGAKRELVSPVKALQAIAAGLKG